MRVQEIFEADIIDFSKVRKQKQSDDASSTIQSIAKSIPSAFQRQEEGEQLVRQKVSEIEKSSEGYQPKYKNPTILSGYQKGIDPMVAWVYSMDTATDDYYRTNYKKYEFVAHEGLKFADDFIRITKEQINRLKQLYKLKELETMPAPQYAKRLIDGAINRYRSNLEMLYDFKHKFDKKYSDNYKKGKDRFMKFVKSIQKKYKSGEIDIEEFKTLRLKKKIELEDRYKVNLDHNVRFIHG